MVFFSSTLGSGQSGRHCPGAAAHGVAVEVRVSGQGTRDGNLEAPQRLPRLGHHRRQLPRQPDWLLQPSHGVANLLGKVRVFTKVANPLPPAPAPAELEIRSVALRPAAHLRGDQALTSERRDVLIG